MKFLKLWLERIGLEGVSLRFRIFKPQTEFLDLLNTTSQRARQGWMEKARENSKFCQIFGQSAYTTSLFSLWCNFIQLNFIGRKPEKFLINFSKLHDKNKRPFYVALMERGVNKGVPNNCNLVFEEQIKLNFSKEKLTLAKVYKCNKF